MDPRVLGYGTAVLMTTFAGYPSGEADDVSEIAIVGAPCDLGATGQPGQRFAPDSIRIAGEYDHDHFLDPYGGFNYANASVLDWGDVEMVIGDYKQSLTEIEEYLIDLSPQFDRLVLLGGDDGVNHPAIAALTAKYGEVTVVHLDAHCDTYVATNEHRRDHGTWIANLIDDGIVTEVWQYGIRATLPALSRGRKYSSAVKWTAIGPDLHGQVEWMLQGFGNRPVYLAIDMDVFDPSCAPGVAFPEPGGYTSREVRFLVQQLGSAFVGMGITELTPVLDPLGLTAQLANRLVLDFVKSTAGSKPVISRVASGE